MTSRVFWPMEPVEPRIVSRRGACLSVVMVRLCASFPTFGTALARKGRGSKCAVQHKSFGEGFKRPGWDGIIRPCTTPLRFKKLQFALCDDDPDRRALPISPNRTRTARSHIRLRSLRAFARVIDVHPGRILHGPVCFPLCVRLCFRRYNGHVQPGSRRWRADRRPWTLYFTTFFVPRKHGLRQPSSTHPASAMA